MKKIGILWFPGWTSTDSDLEELHQYLRGRGIESVSINLTGHNTTPYDLRGVRYTQWLEDARNAFEEYTQEWDYIFVGGLSTGGQLALYLSGQYQVEGVISIATPMRLRLHPLTKFFAPILRYVPIMIQKSGSYGDKRVEQIALSRKGAYSEFPLGSAMESHLLTEKTRREYINTVTVPVLAIQSKTDHLLAEENMDILVSRLQKSGAEVDILWVDNSYHIVVLDHQKSIVFAKIYEFMQRYSILNQE